MKSQALIILICISISTFVKAQTILTVSSGHLVITGNNLVLSNSNLVNNATIDAQSGTVLFNGSTNDVTISGTSSTTFNNLKIDKTSNKVSLSTSTNVDNELEMVSGFLDLVSSDVTLGTDNGTIVGENSTTYIIASSTGEIIKVLSLNVPTSNNPGNMGVEITSTKDLGSTTVRRGHSAKTIGNNSSIERYFTIEPTNNTGLDATIKMYYQDHELNSITESSLEMYRGDNDNWIYYPTNTSDVSGNYIEITNLDSLDDYTMSEGLLKINAKALLAGSYDASGLMYDDLRVADYLPTSQPYTGLGFSHTGTEAIFDGVFDETNDDAIVDWVLLELRDKDDVTNVISTRAALIQKDGDIVDIDGQSSVTFDAAADDYFLVVQHRNHLGIVSASSISLSTTAASYDFTTTLSNTTGASNGILDLGDGYYALYSGDADKSGQTQNTDISQILLIIGTPGYLQEDLNMNGQVQNTDIQNNLQPYIGKGEQY